ncbi:hypothetical protein BJ508DRAFT_327621 [Ascobolus immersus RN42]|uniref:Uncharacterized protein n=1 Tax=Ascobolus immersus RN42 TaxID=1160509 RepID=A0A3N4I1Z0_ASCIM|nr:hypothetical protein BJ508DRAFT_327621 [Ascobolus immersus RN42]
MNPLALAPALGRAPVPVSVIAGISSTLRPTPVLASLHSFPRPNLPAPTHGLVLAGNTPPLSSPSATLLSDTKYHLISTAAPEICKLYRNPKHSSGIIPPQRHRFGPKSFPPPLYFLNRQQSVNISSNATTPYNMADASYYKCNCCRCKFNKVLKELQARLRVWEAPTESLPHMSVIRGIAEELSTKGGLLVRDRPLELDVWLRIRQTRRELRLHDYGRVLATFSEVDVTFPYRVILCEEGVWEVEENRRQNATRNDQASDGTELNARIRYRGRCETTVLTDWIDVSERQAEMDHGSHFVSYYGAEYLGDFGSEFGSYYASHDEYSHVVIVRAYGAITE